MKRQSSQPFVSTPNLIRAALFVTCCCSMSSATFADDWKQFRGPNSTGVSTENKPLPVEFSYEKNVLWSAELGRGIASPVIAAGRVFETTMLDKQTFAVMAFDAKSGKKLWQKEFPAGTFSIPAALIIGTRRESTDRKTSLNDVLREYGIPT